jgi:Chromosome segregation ATPases
MSCLILELENEKKMLQDLLEQALNNEKSGDKDKRINELEKEREKLLSELVQSASKKQNELTKKTMFYEEELRDARNLIVILEKQLDESKMKLEEKKKDLEEAEQMNKCLIQKLKDCQKLITHNEQLLADANKMRAEQEDDFNKLSETQRKTLAHNEKLTQRIHELENEMSSLRMELHESSNSMEMQQHSRKVLMDLESRIANLEVDHEDAESHLNLQLDRMRAICERITELEGEFEKLTNERREVADTLILQENQLSEKVARFSENISWNRDVAACRNEINELTFFVESSKMRIVDIDRLLEELRAEKSVLEQQEKQALERKNL